MASRIQELRPAATRSRSLQLAALALTPLPIQPRSHWWCSKKRGAGSPARFVNSAIYFPVLQLSATFLTVVTASVFEPLALALADALPVVPLASAVLPEAFESGVCDSAEPPVLAVPITSTCLFTFALSCDSSPVSCHTVPLTSVSM